jgi:hypothetical protein
MVCSGVRDAIPTKLLAEDWGPVINERNVDESTVEDMGKLFNVAARHTRSPEEGPVGARRDAVGRRDRTHPAERSNRASNLADDRGQLH